jgi:hypothetical protein
MAARARRVLVAGLALAGTRDTDCDVLLRVDAGFQGVAASGPVAGLEGALLSTKPLHAVERIETGARSSRDIGELLIYCGCLVHHETVNLDRSIGESTPTYIVRVLVVDFEVGHRRGEAIRQAPIGSLCREVRLSRTAECCADQKNAGQADRLMALHVARRMQTAFLQVSS